jgi:hypothetical protein
LWPGRVHDDDIARAQFGHQDFGDIGLEGEAVDRPIDHEGRDEAAQRECADEGRGLPMAMGNAHPQALAAPAAPIAARHVGGGPSLIDKHQALGIQVELPLEPGLAFRQDVRAGLLAGMGGLFLRVIA